jgi:enterobactin synthetase component D
MEHSGEKANEVAEALLALPSQQICLASCSNFDAQSLVSDEILSISSAKSPKRFREFTLGRSAARKAMQALEQGSAEYQTFPLLRLESGLVAWPSGIVGSISHCRGIAIAAVAKTNDYSTLGLDIEYFRPISDKVIARIASEQEMQILLPLKQDNNISFFSIFSAKESIFKALYPIVRKHFGFHAVSLVKLSNYQQLCHSDLLCKLEFSLEQELSTEFYNGATLPVWLFVGKTFCLTICSITGL